MSAINPHGVKIEYGKHEGCLFTRLPLSYLRWMINENAPQADVAKAELERRGGDIPKVQISGHALDRASFRVMKIWEEDRNDDEGFYSWLCRMTLEAIAQGAPIGDRLHYKGMKFCVAKGEEFPVLKTVMRNKAND